MSKKIDLTEPLSDDDRQYLIDRCRWSDLHEADASYPAPEPRDPNASPTSVDTPAALHPADTGTQNAELPTTPLPPVSAPVEAEAQFGNSEDGDNYDDASAWSYSDLQKEAKSRKDVGAAGSREEIVARLREDDKAN